MAEEPPSPDLEEAGRRLREALNRGDLDAAVAMYAPYAVWDVSLLGLEGVFEGRKAIRGAYEDLIAPAGCGALQSVHALEVANGLHSVLEVREQSVELVGGAHPHASRRYGWAMAPRTRRLALGAAAALVLAGVACAVLVAGVPGEILTTVLIAAGLGGVVVLVFLEIGFGEERDLAREEERKQKRAERIGRRRPRLPRRRGPD